MHIHAEPPIPFLTYKLFEGVGSFEVRQHLFKGVPPN